MVAAAIATDNQRSIMTGLGGHAQHSINHHDRPTAGKRVESSLAVTSPCFLVRHSSPPPPPPQQASQIAKRAPNCRLQPQRAVAVRLSRDATQRRQGDCLCSHRLDRPRPTEPKARQQHQGKDRDRRRRYALCLGQQVDRAMHVMSDPTQTAGAATASSFAGGWRAGWRPTGPRDRQGPGGEEDGGDKMQKARSLPCRATTACLVTAARAEAENQPTDTGAGVFAASNPAALSCSSTYINRSLGGHVFCTPRSRSRAPGGQATPRRGPLHS